MDSRDYPIYLQKLSTEDGGGFLAIAIDLPGCMSDGETEAEALANVRLAVLEWIDDAEKNGEQVPAPYSAEVESKAEAEVVSKLITKQDELIEKQGHLLGRQEQAVKSLQKNIASLRQEISSSRAIDPTSPVWGDHVSAVRRVARARTKSKRTVSTAH